MASNDEILIKIKSIVDQSGLDKGLRDVDSKIKNTTTKGESMFKSMFGALALGSAIKAGFNVVKNFLEDSIEGAKEAELNALQLKATLSNIGKENYFDKIIEQADILSQKFAVDDDMIVKMTTSLETYGKLTEQQITELQPIILDYAAKTGQSLDAATGDIIKGLEGSGKAFKQFGIEIKAGSTDAENYGIIVDQLGGKVKGAGEAFANSSAGGMAQFNIALDNFKEDVGKEIIPLIADLMKELTPLFKTALPMIRDVFKGLAPILKTTFDTLKGVLKPIGDVLKTLFDSFKKLMPVIQPFLKAVGDLAKKIAEKLAPIISKLIKAMEPLIEAILPVLTTILEGLSPIIDVVAGALGFVIDLITPLIKLISNLITKIYEWKKSFDEIIDKALGPVIKKVKEFIGWMKDAYDSVVDFLGLGDEEPQLPARMSSVGDAAEDMADKITTGNEDIIKSDDKVTTTVTKNSKTKKDTIQDHLKVVQELRDKYFLSERDQVAKGFDDDMVKLNLKDKAELELYNKLFEAKKKALEDFDNNVLKESLQKELKEFGDHNALLVAQTEDGSQERIDIEQKTTDDFISKMDAMASNGKLVYENLGLSADEWALKKIELIQKVKDAQDGYDKKIKESADAEVQLVKDTTEKGIAARDEESLKGVEAAKRYVEMASQFSSSLFDFINNITKKGSETNKKAAKARFVTEKGLNMVMGGINTAGAIIKALNDPGGIAGGVLAGIYGAMGAVQIASIATKKFDPGNESPSASVPTPSLSLPTSFQSPSQMIGLGQQQIMPTQQGLNYQKVYVTETDISKTMNKINVIEARATI
jgi:hypothetical protein